HDVNAWKIFLRGHADAVLLDFIRDGAIARRHRVTGVEHDFTFHRCGVVPTNLRNRAVRHRDEKDLAKRNRLLDRTRLREAAKLCHHGLQFLGMTRGKQYRVATLDPETSDRATNIA